MTLNGDNNNDKELEVEKREEENHLPSLEMAEARIALSLERYKIAVEKVATSGTAPKKIRL